MNHPYQGAAQEYVRAELNPPDPRGIDWEHKPCQFKLYRSCVQIPLPYQGSREWDGVSFALGQIGELLADLYGLVQQAHLASPVASHIAGSMGALQNVCRLRRTVPSGGALFPCEIYLFIRDGDCFPAGIYHYDVAHHALDLLEPGDALEAACSLLAHAGSSPTCMIALSCFFWKNGFKYGAFSYRLQGFDIGTIIAQAQALLNRRALLATVHYQFLDAGIDSLLGLDPWQESIYALIALEQPGAQQSNRPPSEQRGDMLSARTAPTAPKVMPIAQWPLVEAVHRAALMETSEQFRELRCLAPLTTPAFRVEYPLPPITQEVELLAHYQQRHSAGHFLSQPINASQFGLLCCLSLSGYQNDIDGLSTILQHTLLYCVVNRVEGIPKGIYVYNPQKHACELVTAGDRQRELQAIQKRSLPNTHGPDSSACFFAVGSYTAGFQQFGDRWYRMQNMEAGMLVQHLYLTAAALQLGCRASLGFYERDARRLLALSEDENVLIQVMIGPEAAPYASYEQSLR